MIRNHQKKDPSRAVLMSFLFHVGDLLLDGKEPIDDSVDKIHRRVTILFLLLLSIPLFTKQFAGEPIECFTPTYFTEAQSRYVNSYCWTVSTFYPQQRNVNQQRKVFPPGQPLPDNRLIHSVDYVDEYEVDSLGASTGQQHSSSDRPVIQQQNVTRVNYYQWAPMILLAKAVTFYIPFALWKALARQRGTSLRHLMKRINRLHHIGTSHPERADVVEEIVEQFYMLMNSRLSNSRPSKGHCGRILHNFRSHRMLTTYFFIKCLYFLNVLLQFYLLVSFLGEDYLTHGWDIAKHFWERNEWWTSPRFPLQTLCSVRAAQQGSLRLYQCHCVLPINLFNEKICSIWWFYITALLPVTAANIILWTVRCFKSSTRLEFIRSYLKQDPHQEDLSASSVAALVLINHLGQDGLFLLRLIEINHGRAVLGPIVDRLQERLTDGIQYHPPSDSSITVEMARPINTVSEFTTMPQPISSVLQQQKHQDVSNSRPGSPLGISLFHRRLHRTVGNDPFRRSRMRRSLQIHPGRETY